MTNANKEKLSYIFEIIFILILFLGISYVVQQNIDFFRENLGDGFLGVLLYILFIQLAIVFVPLSSIPLIPLASNLWGPFFTSLILIFSWTLGAAVVFFICRKWGVSIIGKLIPLRKLHKIEGKIPKEGEFWTIVLLRMIIPVDILSYALGLFSKINFKRYILATLIGVTPFTILIAYVGAMPFIYQILASLVIGIFILAWVIFKSLNKTQSSSIQE